MGLKCSPDFTQEVMKGIFSNLDVGVFSKFWENHVEILDKVLKRLQDNGFMINPLKCKWGDQETDRLGYWLTPTGLIPLKKKI